MAHVIEGTWDEISSHAADLAGHRLRLIVDPMDEDLTVSDRQSPIAVRDQDHLIELLVEGTHSPKHEVTEEIWARKHQELNDRYATRRQ